MQKWILNLIKKVKYMIVWVIQFKMKKEIALNLVTVKLSN